MIDVYASESDDEALLREFGRDATVEVIHVSAKSPPPGVDRQLIVSQPYDPVGDPVPDLDTYLASRDRRINRQVEKKNRSRQVATNLTGTGHERRHSTLSSETVP